MRSRLPLRRLSLACGFVLSARSVGVPSAAAQWQVDALVGHAFTTYEVTAVPPPGGGAQSITYQQRDDVPPLAVGGRVSLLRRRWGFELGLALDKADVVVTQDDGSGLPGAQRRSGRVLYLGFRGLALLDQAGGSGPSFHFGAGPTLSWRMGDAYEGSSGTRNVGIVLGVGSRFRLGRINFRLDLEDYVYRLGIVDASGTQFPTKTQNDVLISLGVGLYRSAQ